MGQVIVAEGLSESAEGRGKQGGMGKGYKLSRLGGGHDGGGSLVLWFRWC